MRFLEPKMETDFLRGLFKRSVIRARVSTAVMFLVALVSLLSFLPNLAPVPMFAVTGCFIFDLGAFYYLSMRKKSSPILARYLVWQVFLRNFSLIFICRYVTADENATWFGVVLGAGLLPVFRPKTSDGCIMSLIALLVSVTLSALYMNLNHTVAVIVPVFGALFVGIQVGANVEYCERRKFNLLHLFLERKSHVKKQKKRSEEVLRNILPAQIIEELRCGRDHCVNRRYDAATIVFIGLVDIPPLVQLDATKYVKYLNDVFSRMERLCDRYKVEKIKTIGPLFMAGCGFPEEREDHADAAADFCLALIAMAERIGLILKIGINVGPVVAGIIGSKFQYDVWGDTVNTSSRMYSTGERGYVHASEEAYKRLGTMQYSWQERGAVYIKGKGTMNTYYLLFRNDSKMETPMSHKFESQGSFSTLPLSSSNPATPATAARSGRTDRRSSISSLPAHAQILLRAAPSSESESESETVAGPEGRARRPHSRNRIADSSSVDPKAQSEQGAADQSSPHGSHVTIKGWNVSDRPAPPVAAGPANYGSHSTQGTHIASHGSQAVIPRHPSSLTVAINGMAYGSSGNVSRLGQDASACSTPYGSVMNVPLDWFDDSQSNAFDLVQIIRPLVQSTAHQPHHPPSAKDNGTHRTHSRSTTPARTGRRAFPSLSLKYMAPDEPTTPGLSSALHDYTPATSRTASADQPIPFPRQQNPLHVVNHQRLDAPSAANSAVMTPSTSPPLHRTTRMPTRRDNSFVSVCTRGSESSVDGGGPSGETCSSSTTTPRGRPLWPGGRRRKELAPQALSPVRSSPEPTHKLNGDVVPPGNEAGSVSVATVAQVLDVDGQSFCRRQTATSDLEAEPETPNGDRASRDVRSEYDSICLVSVLDSTDPESRDGLDGVTSPPTPATTAVTPTSHDPFPANTSVSGRSRRHSRRSVRSLLPSVLADAAWLPSGSLEESPAFDSTNPGQSYSPVEGYVLSRESTATTMARDVMDQGTDMDRGDGRTDSRDGADQDSVRDMYMERGPGRQTPDKGSFEKVAPQGGRNQKLNNNLYNNDANNGNPKYPRRVSSTISTASTTCSSSSPGMVVTTVSQRRISVASYQSESGESYYGLNQSEPASPTPMQGPSTRTHTTTTTSPGRNPLHRDGGYAQSEPGESNYVLNQSEPASPTPMQAPPTVTHTTTTAPGCSSPHRDGSHAPAPQNCPNAPAAESPGIANPLRPNGNSDPPIPSDPGNNTQATNDSHHTPPRRFSDLCVQLPSPQPRRDSLPPLPVPMALADSFLRNLGGLSPQPHRFLNMPQESPYFFGQSASSEQVSSGSTNPHQKLQHPQLPLPEALIRSNSALTSNAINNVANHIVTTTSSPADPLNATRPDPAGPPSRLHRRSQSQRAYPSPATNRPLGHVSHHVSVSFGPATSSPNKGEATYPRPSLSKSQSRPTPSDHATFTTVTTATSKALMKHPPSSLLSIPTQSTRLGSAVLPPSSPYSALVSPASMISIPSTSCSPFAAQMSPFFSQSSHVGFDIPSGPPSRSLRQKSLKSGRVKVGFNDDFDSRVTDSNPITQSVDKFPSNNLPPSTHLKFSDKISAIASPSDQSPTGVSTCWINDNGQSNFSVEENTGSPVLSPVMSTATASWRTTAEGRGQRNARATIRRSLFGRPSLRPGAMARVTGSPPWYDIFPRVYRKVTMSFVNKDQEMDFWCDHYRSSRHLCLHSLVTYLIYLFLWTGAELWLDWSSGVVHLALIIGFLVPVLLVFYFLTLSEERWERNPRLIGNGVLLSVCLSVGIRGLTNSLLPSCLRRVSLDMAQMLLASFFVATYPAARLVDVLFLATLCHSFVFAMSFLSGWRWLPVTHTIASFVCCILSVYFGEKSGRHGFLICQGAQRESESLEKEKGGTEELLRCCMPDHILDSLRMNTSGSSVLVDSFDDIIISCMDVVGFTDLSTKLEPSQLVDMLNDLVVAFDSLSTTFHVYKIKTIGDCYMAAALPQQKDDGRDPYENLLLFAHECQQFLRKYSNACVEGPIQMRCGIGSGPAVGGVIGTRKWFFDIWGPAVDTACHLESSGVPGHIQVSPEIASRTSHIFDFVPRSHDLPNSPHFLIGPRVSCPTS